MKAIVIYIIACTLFISCSNTSKPSQTPLTNQFTKDSKGTAMLLGHCSNEALRKAPFNSWFDTAFTAYKPEASAIATLKPIINNTVIEIFLGTWCGDSRREVPRLLKTMSETGFDTSNIRMILVDHDAGAYKQSPQHEEKGKYIFRVPTAIVYQNNKEIGRVIETPVVNWEKDLVAITTHQPYTPHYDVANKWLHTVLKQKLSTNEMTNAAATYKGQFNAAGILNSMGYFLLGQKKESAAIETFTLNTLLFPTDANTWDSLAEAYATNGNKSMAITYYKKVLEIKPGDANAMEKLNGLNK